MQSSLSDNYVHRYNIEIFNLLGPEVQMIHSKLMIKNILKEFLSELKSLKLSQYCSKNIRK